MASNPGSNNGSQYYRRHLYSQNPSSSSSSTGPGSLPPASELLSPSPALGYPTNKARHPLHSVSSPSVGPPSPYLGQHNNYQSLTEPGTPATFLGQSGDPAPSPSYESIASPASNNHVNQSAGSTKPSTPMTECRASPIPNGIYNSYPSAHYYQPGQQPYQRLPSVDSLPSSSGYYNSPNPGHMPHPNQHHNVYVRPMDRPSHPVPPGAYMTQTANPTGDNVQIYPTNDDYMNGPSQDHYYPDPYAQSPSQQQPSNSPSTYNPHLQYGQLNRQYSQQAIKQPIHQSRTPSLQRQFVYQQAMHPSQQNMQSAPVQHVYIQPPGQYSQQTGQAPHVVNLYDGSMVDQRAQPPSPYNPPQMPPASNAYITPNGTNSQQQKSMPDGVVTNATQSPIMSTVNPNSQTNMTDSAPIQVEKPKKPAPKRNRKTAAQLKAEAAAKAIELQKQQQLTNQQPGTEDIGSTQRPMVAKPNNGEHSDTSSLLMPPPKVAQAPSVVAAAAKAMYSTPPPTNSNQSTPQKQESPQQFNQSPINPHESNQQANPIVEIQHPTQAQSKRQRTASQRSQQQMARLQKQKEFELLKAREEREYLVKFVQLRRTVRALVFKNGALADEVSRLKMQIDICREERKMVAKRVQHYERNRIRRQQTQERKALARAAAAQQQLEQKSTDTAEDDDNSRSMDVILPLNDLQQRPPINFQSMAEPHADAISSILESMQKSRNAPTTPRKRSRASKNSDPNEHAPAKRRRSNGDSISESTNKPSNSNQQQLKLQIIRDEFLTNPPRSHESSNSMDYSPVMPKQHLQQSILMSPADEMQYLIMNRLENVQDMEENNGRKSPLKIQISEEPLQPDNSSASTPTKPNFQLTPTGRKKSESVTSTGTSESLRKRVSTRLQQQQRQSTPPTPNEDIVSLRTRSASRSQPSGSNHSPKPGRITPSSSTAALTALNTTPSTSSSFSMSPSLLLNTSSTSIGLNPQVAPNLSPLPTRELYTRFPTNFLEPFNTTPIDSPQSANNEKLTDEPRENDFDRPLSEQQLAALKSERHLRSNSSTTEAGAETRQRVNSRASKSRPPRHSLTPSSLADSETMSNSASPVPFLSGDPNNPSNTPTVMTRRKAAEIATSTTTPPMKTRSKSKQNS